MTAHLTVVTSLSSRKACIGHAAMSSCRNRSKTGCELCDPSDHPTLTLRTLFSASASKLSLANVVARLIYHDHFAARMQATAGSWPHWSQLSCNVMWSYLFWSHDQRGDKINLFYPPRRQSIWLKKVHFSDKIIHQLISHSARSRQLANVQLQ